MFRKKVRGKLKLDKIMHWKVIATLLMIYDLAAIIFSYFFALWIRFEFSFSEIPLIYMKAYREFVPIYAVISVLVFCFLNMYRSIWRYAGANELVRYILVSFASSVVNCVGITVLFRRMPFSYYIIGTGTQIALIVGIRFSYRFYITFLKSKKTAPGKRKKNIMIIGAGAAGRNLIRELLGSDVINAAPCCVIDDNENKWGRYIYGVPIVGGRDDILFNVEKYEIDQIYFSIPSAMIRDRRNILNICNETGCVLKSLPNIYQLMNGDALSSKLKPVAVEDLLGREPTKVSMDEIFNFVKGKVILVTGGGGSIGSELCRQVAGHSPEHLIIFDIYENNAYEIEQELRKKYPQLRLTVLIGSVRDSRRIFDVFDEYKPDIVYHAAAHKHVPLMEDSPCEAIKNNVMGTYKTACAALMNGCRRFVLISTDKAVNPTNIMGASKRLCEMVIQSMDYISKTEKYDLLPYLNTNKELTDLFESDELDEVIRENIKNSSSKKCRTEFVAVRFGNVLGSNGSVIPLFKKQIAQGGPVTVTHPDIIRYFMTIPEAVNLVLQAGTYANGGEIFVLDMGEPVKIDTLARNLIKLSGYKPDEDIKIVYSGLRPGEKLYEEKLMAEEGLTKTENKLIHIGKPIPFDIEDFMDQLKFLAEACYDNSENIYSIVENIVPTFHPAKEQDESQQDKPFQEKSPAYASENVLVKL